MDTKARILSIRVLKKMAVLPEYARKIGLTDDSHFRTFPDTNASDPKTAAGAKLREK